MEIRTVEKANLATLRSNLGSLGLGEVELQRFGNDRDVLIRIERQPGGANGQKNAVEKVKNTLSSTIDYRRTEFVGPKVSGELIEAGVTAVLLALFAMLIYIWFRFEWQFAIGAIAALIHDVLITIGIFSVLSLEFNLAIIAALLTIIGYSLNDTVVVFDRVRENLKKHISIKIFELTNISINETLSRTIITSITTLLALLSIYLFGGEILKGFSLAMILGVILGTYSSIYIANPILVMLKVSQKTIIKEEKN